MNDFIFVGSHIQYPANVSLRALIIFQVPTSRVEETLGILLQSGYQIIDERGTYRERSSSGGLGLLSQRNPNKPAVPMFPPGQFPTLFRFTTASTPKNERPRLSVSITGLPPSPERSRSKSISSRSPNSSSSSPRSHSPTMSMGHPLLPISVVQGSFAMVGLVPQATHAWSSLMIKLFLYPRLLYPSYWGGPDDPGSSGTLSSIDEISERLGRSDFANGMFADRFRRSTLSNTRVRRDSLAPTSPRSANSSPNPRTTADVASAVSAIPYASFTRTAQGTSLVTDVHTLYLLFPSPYDRQSMLIASNNELDDVIEYYAMHGGGVPKDYYSLYRDHPHGNRSERTGMTSWSPPPGMDWPRVKPDREEVVRRAAERFGVYSLLQVDLRAFQLGECKKCRGDIESDLMRDNRPIRGCGPTL